MFFVTRYSARLVASRKPRSRVGSIRSLSKLALFTIAAAIVNSASYDKDRIEPTLDRGFLDATSLAEYLVTRGVPFRTAHHVVGTLVARCEREGKHALSQLPVEAFNEVLATKSDVRVDADVYNALGARNVVKRYQSAGAAGGKPFEEQLAAWKKRLGI